jgi:hypothetical protein
MSDKPILNQYEIDVLRECNGEPWPRVLERLRSLSTKEREAYVDDRLAAIRSVINRGFVKNGTTPKLTDAGRAALYPAPNKGARDE